MPAVEPRDFRSTPAQRAFYEKVRRDTQSVIDVDLDTEASAEHAMPCLDCDEAGCEKCGGTGRRRP